MLRILVVFVWVLLIVVTALALQVIANWILTLALVLYIFSRWQARRKLTANVGSPQLSESAAPFRAQSVAFGHPQRGVRRWR
jgi:hypothetical protein